MTASGKKTAIYQDNTGVFPTDDSELWKDAAFCSFWELSGKTVNISVEDQNYDKVIWPEVIDSGTGEKI